MKTTKLLQIQQLLKAPKNQHNNFGNYNYRSCEDILEAVKPILDSVGATLTLSDEVVAVGDRIYIKATATLKDIETGEIIDQTTAYAREEETKKGMDSSQITGSSSSYARKYSLNGLFCIDDVKDSDSTNTHGKENGFNDRPETVKETIKRVKKEEKADIESGDWYQKALQNTDFMGACLDADTYMEKIKSKYKPTDEQEHNLRIAFDNYKKLQSMNFDSSIFNS